MLLDNARRLHRPVLWLLLLAALLCFTAFMLSFQLPDLQEFEISREIKIAREGKVDQASADDLNDQPELYSLETAPFVNETVAEGRQRLQKIAIRPDFIFISISSYRDDNCIQTLSQIFTKCRHCDRIRIGLVDQLADGDPPCQLPPDLHEQFQSQIRTIRMHASQARGPTFARYLTSRLWRGEQYLLQIDAHLNFIADWDRRLLRMVPRMPSEKFVISHYPVATVAELENRDGAVPFICKARFHDYMKGLFLQDSGWYRIKDHNGQPQASPFIGAGFLFAPHTMLIDVPFDRYLDFLFHGEEFAYSARLWTSGYELVVPLENIASHVYGHRKNNAFVDNRKSSQLAEQARDRVRYVLGMSETQPSRMEEIDDLGLGDSRTFQHYLRYTGLDLAKRTIAPHCNDLYDWETQQWRSANQPKPPELKLMVPSPKFMPPTRLGLRHHRHRFGKYPYLVVH